MERTGPFWPDEAAVTAWLARLDGMPPGELGDRARSLKASAHGRLVSYSPKVFIPLTRLCRDVCGYCTFTHPRRPGERAFMTADEVLAVARAGQEAGCTEALFTLGELPEQRYPAVRRELDDLGASSTLDYLARMARLVLDETGLLPHLNAGVMGRDDLAMLRRVGVSQGLMLEGTSPRLIERGGPHYGSIGKQPQARIDTIATAGELAIPFTTGLLIGLGESRADRIEALLVIAALQVRYGHIQEVIVQNFQPKPGTRMANVPGASHEELLWTAAAARLILGAAMSIQVPPNLSYDRFPELLDAGINDWGGVSPVTPDHVNPEARWPAIEWLRAATEAAGQSLVARLPVYPGHVADRDRWIDPGLHAAVLRQSDASGWARADRWSPGLAGVAPFRAPEKGRRQVPALEALLARAEAGDRLGESEVAALFACRGPDADRVIESADALRARVSGEDVRYVVNRNINYTNVCSWRCTFCAFSKGKTAETLRGRPYNVPIEEVTRRSAEAWDRGATEVCMQGGIHPSYTGDTYLELLRAVQRGAPGMHVHAFSPLEVTHGAETLGLGIESYLGRLRDAGLGSLPGTAAEILSDDARAILCPDKLSTAGWLSVMEAAHRVGLRSTATIMFGHIDTPAHWARHLLALRDLQERTGGFTEFVPLPFVHMEAPLYHKGRARKGPTFEETLLMHAVARLVLHPLIANIQVSWVKLGGDGVRAVLRAGANDLGGTLMNESISRAAGTEHGQELPPEAMDALIRSAGRLPGQRTTLYGVPPAGQTARSYGARELAPLVTGEIGGPRRRAVA
ncbi:5-amino-6-(D-ribitylamino)uracil--L-tyrosine 4-hydroxyphenyl transferase CofH [Alsobacter sp. SYSU M60028]|uniref:FO synthase n=1 Tax=Alsobacter ponti TaxID=2962936 RepID=A0ABT1LFR5_9HYPH|nr:5-amino-6-(D-ribitylamino)uracil--L-tyrosine 4-hydroxyphenyl transferase CofH [Alsobacter ponti]MCP8939941.1 5-amino-6-(D-ribitylamino)uracil--L-tyrosine 4-hydroxyphenyl transferase CofH [Alsobacter ponti]